MEMYSIYDRKLREYGQILLAPNIGTVSRTIVMGVRGSKSTMDQYPEDFELHKVGEFDTQSGQVTANGRPEILVTLDLLMENANGKG